MKVMLDPVRLPCGKAFALQGGCASRASAFTLVVLWLATRPDVHSLGEQASGHVVGPKVKEVPDPGLVPILIFD